MSSRFLNFSRVKSVSYLRNCQMSNDKLALIIAMTMSKSRKSEFLEHT